MTPKDRQHFLRADLITKAVLCLLFLMCPGVLRAENRDTDTATVDDTVDDVVRVTCPASLPHGVSVFALPQLPTPDRPVRLVALSGLDQQHLSLQLFNAQHQVIRPVRDESWGFIPRATSVQFDLLPAGTYQVVLSDTDSQVIVGCFDLQVMPSKSGNAPAVSTDIPWEQVWKVTGDWTVAMENLYSAFVARLFHVERGASKGWRPLGRATQDPFRNILYGILGFNEDSPDADVPVILSPDCADAPMQVRAYFAWKMGLPILLNECVRGTSMAGPWCYNRHDNQNGNPRDIAHPVARFNRFIETTVNWKTHAGSYRTLPDDSESVVYPIALTRESLRPGTVFVDAGGHIILVTQIEPQAEKTVGALYGVDGHPDFTVTHKAFSRGTFVFNANVPTDGFKAFRPAVRKENGLGFVSNSELSALSAWQGLPQYSPAQSSLASIEQFYTAVQKALNPNPIVPVEMLLSKVAVLHHAAEERVEAVQLGVDYMHETYWKTMDIPNGPAIFQTIGPWEIYSTPARDMRLLLVIDDVLKFASQVIRHPELYAPPPSQEGDAPVDTESDLNLILSSSLKEKSVTYIRSDNSPWTLTLADIVNRRAELEMGYNPNDCPEVRWGAPSHSEERSTCSHRTPLGQIRLMQQYRKWFVDRRRPDQR